jgi:NAD(P)-dependent dehydrogenase (short-subunit alcohol dehydrogenase family)
MPKRFRGSIDDVDPQAWRRGWDLKVFGYIHMTRYVLPHMKARKSGVIVNIIGMAGERPEPGYIATSCGNAALVMFTQCLGGESMRDGGGSSASTPDRSCPTGTSAAPNGSPSASWATRTFGPELYKRFAIGRPGRVAEVAWMVAFLASDRASCISGETIRIDAGLKVRDPVY